LKKVVVSQHLSAYTAPDLVGFTEIQLLAVTGARGFAANTSDCTELQITVTNKNVRITKYKNFRFIQFATGVGFY